MHGSVDAVSSACAVISLSTQKQRSVTNRGEILTGTPLGNKTWPVPTINSQTVVMSCMFELARTHLWTFSPTANKTGLSEKRSCSRNAWEEQRSAELTQPCIVLAEKMWWTERLAVLTRSFNERKMKHGSWICMKTLETNHVGSRRHRIVYLYEPWLAEGSDA